MSTCTCTVEQLPNGVGRRTGWQSCPEHRYEAAINVIRQDAVERQAMTLFEHLGTYQSGDMEGTWHGMEQWRYPPRSLWPLIMAGRRQQGPQWW